MQLTRAADYAIRVMTHLAGLPSGSRVSRSVLATATSVPDSFLSKVLQALARAQLVESRRGPDGGFELTADVQQLSLLEVVEAIDGPIRLNACLNSGGSCERQTWCSVRPVWQRSQDAMLDVLRSTTISELAKQAAINQASLGSDRQSGAKASDLS